MLARPWRNMVWSSASSTLIGLFVFTFVLGFSPNTPRCAPLVRLERHCIVYATPFRATVVSLIFDVVGHIPTVRRASSSAIHPSAWKGNSAKYVPQQQRRFLRRFLTGLRCLRYSLCACRTIEGQCLSK